LSLPARSPSPQEPYDNSGEASSSDHDDDIPSLAADFSSWFL
jgi:hypothetical protein